MITLELRYDRSMLKNIGKGMDQLPEAARPLVRALGTRYVELAQDESPRRSGRFAKSISFQEFAGNQSFGFYGLSAKPIGHFIILGTKPHKISPRRANALYFFWTKAGMYTVVPKGGGFRTHVAGGKLWIGKGFVQHPGTPPNPFPARALARLKEDIDKILQSLGDRWVQIVQRST